MNKLLTIILGIGSGIGVLFSAIFYVLFRQAKEERLNNNIVQQKKETDNLRDQVEFADRIHKADVTNRQDNQNEIEKIITSHGSDAVNIANDIVSKLSQKRASDIH